MMSSCGLKIQNVQFRFTKQSPDFFKDLSVAFEAGKIHFVRGPNGAGKSTLFRLVQGKIDTSEVASGTISVGEKQYQFRPGSVPHVDEIKMVQQKFDLMLADQLSFAHNLQLANMSEYPRLSPLPEHQPLPAFVNRFGINMQTPVYLLSGGQRQILSILMALQKPARVLLLDEPTAALDDKNSKMVMDFLFELIGTLGLTILIICHDKELVDTYAPEGYFEFSINPGSGQRLISLKQK